MLSNRPLRKIAPFATQLRATPPARHRFLSPVSALSAFASRKTTSSRTIWIDAAWFIFHGIHLKPCVIDKGRVQQDDAGRKTDLLDHLETVSPDHTHRSGRPLPHYFHGEDHVLAIRRGKERGGRMALMVFGKEQARL